MAIVDGPHHFALLCGQRRLEILDARETLSKFVVDGMPDWRKFKAAVGGIIERVIGTLMELVHALPGTTFSNPTERGSYDSDRTACLTLDSKR